MARKSKLAVSEAMYNKFSSKFSPAPPLVRSSSSHLFLKKSARGPSLPVGLAGEAEMSKHARSYAQVVNGEFAEGICGLPPAMSRKVRIDLLLSPPAATPRFSFKGLKNVMKWGGRVAILEFVSKEALVEAVNDEGWRSYLDDFHPWNGEMVNLARLVWLECRFLLISAWNQNSFATIAEQWGNLVATHASTLTKLDLSAARILVETEKRVISGSFIVSVGGASSVDDVSEVAGEEGTDPWSPCLIRSVLDLSREMDNGQQDNAGTLPEIFGIRSADGDFSPASAYSPIWLTLLLFNLWLHSLLARK